MMRVVFLDKPRETYHAVGDVVQLDSAIEKANGRYTAFWLLEKTDGSVESFKQKDFLIYRIEI